MPLGALLGCITISGMQEDNIYKFDIGISKGFRTNRICVISAILKKVNLKCEPLLNGAICHKPNQNRIKR